MYDEYKEKGRNKAKDALAWAILYGGTAAAKFAICTVGVAAGFVDRGTAKQVTIFVAKMTPQMKKSAWEVYTQTGNIGAMIDKYMHG